MGETMLALGIGWCAVAEAIYADGDRLVVGRQGEYVYSIACSTESLVWRSSSIQTGYCCFFAALGLATAV